MLRVLSVSVAAAMVCATGLVTAVAQQTKKAQGLEIPGGIHGQIKSVDVEKQVLRITTDGGRERTFSVTDDTTMLGPRGGRVRRRLNDRRFHEGMELTVVADGGTAKEIHLGFSRREGSSSSSAAKAAGKNTSPGTARTGGATASVPAVAKRPAGSAKGTAKIGAKAAADDEDDEDDEFPGRVKSFDESRRLLVVTLLNGGSRSFLLSSDVKVLVRGTPSKQGLRDAALRADAPISVFVEPGTRRVTEIHVGPAALTKGRSKKAA
jgi:hypothetical protein